MSNTGAENNTSLNGLSYAENKLVTDAEAWLENNNPKECFLVKERFSHLRVLGNAVFSYPSIRHTHFLNGVVRGEGQLAKALLAFSKSSHLLHIPTKVVTMRGFLVAKYHAFSLLFYLLNEKPDWQAEVRNIAFSVISTLMAEAVYFSCLEDAGFSQKTKTALANDLIALWDSGIDLRGLRHLSALSSLWVARDTSPPSFGTMNGTSELLRITMDMDEDWREFLVVESDNAETRWALEEFIFGLSWEEIQKVRSVLSRFGVSAINYNQIHSYLDSKPAYSIVTERDPRSFYDFFIERRDACNLREKTNAPGPKHTLEEIYLKYRIIVEQK